MTIEDVLNDKEIKDLFQEETPLKEGQSLDVEFAKEIERLWCSWPNHYLDCKCLLCR